MAEFGQDFLQVKQFQVAQNKRRVNARAIYRAVNMCRKNLAVRLSKGELEAHLKHLKTNYAEFIAEHKILLTLIPPRKIDKLKEQEKYQEQVERDFIRTVGDLKDMISDKNFLNMAADVERANRNRFGSPERLLPEVRSETGRMVESILVEAQKTIEKIRAEEGTNLKKSAECANENEQAGPSGMQQKNRKPLNQMWESCGLQTSSAGPYRGVSTQGGTKIFWGGKIDQKRSPKF